MEVLLDKRRNDSEASVKTIHLKLSFIVQRQDIEDANTVAVDKFFGNLGPVALISDFSLTTTSREAWKNVDNTKVVSLL